MAQQPEVALARRAASTPPARICLIGHTGAGKSTTAGLLADALAARGRRVEVVKLAEPLYRLQGEVYRVAGRPIEHYAQDQLLLEALATHLRRISASALVDDFVRRLDAVRADVVLNDDLRDPWTDWPALRQLGFRVVRVVASRETRAARLAGRGDVASLLDSASTAELDRIEPDELLENEGSLAELRAAVERLAERLA